MKIIFFIPYLIGGGAQRVVINLLLNLNRQHNILKLVVINKSGPFLSKLPEEVELIELKSKRVLTSVFELKRLFKKEKPEVIISFLSYANIIAIISSKLAKVSSKIIVTEHSNYLVGRSSNFIKNYIFDFLLRKTYKFADEIITVSKGVTESLLQSGFQKSKYNFTTIYNPIVTSELIKNKEKKINHKWFNTPDIKVIIAVGSLRKAKDYPTLIKSFSIIKKENPKSRLVIMGEGDERGNIENLIEDMKLDNYVDLLGYKDNPFAHMSKADIFILSSQWEGFGNVIVEAMACGTPVISTDCLYGPNEIIDNMKDGILTPVGDEVEMAKNINLLLDNKELQIKFIENGLKKSKKFEANKIANLYENIFNK